MANTGLLIDYNSIIKPNDLGRLVSKIKPVPETKFVLGLVLVIPEDELAILEKIKKGKSRVLYLNNPTFVDSIKGYAYVIYDKERKICEIMGVQGFFLSNITESILSSFPNDILVWVGLSLNNDDFNILVNNYIEAGFQDPFICKVSPLGYSYDYYGLCMTKKNDIITADASSDVKYVLEQFKNRDNNCHMTGKFTDKTISYLKKLARIGSTLNKDGTITQKEMAGRFIAEQPDSNNIFPLKIDRSSIISGNEEGVKIKEGLYNFHTHPKEAYERNNVKNGWPSSQDFVGFISASKIYSTILHAVVTLEGIYIISIGKYWVSRKDKIDQNVIKFIHKKYTIHGRNDRDISWYLRTVNSISLNNFPLFTVEFLEWSDSSAPFDVYFTKHYSNCFARDTTLNKYKHFY